LKGRADFAGGACKYAMRKMLTKDKAICIRAVDYSETSQIVTFFTSRNGKVSAIAKGSKRPKSAFDGPIEIFAFGQIVFSDSTREKLATLTEFQTAAGEAAFSLAAGNLFALNCCLFAVELLSSLTDDCDPHPALFDGLLEFLRDVRNTARTPKAHCNILVFLILFQLFLLRQVGLQPVLKACASCKSRYDANWSQAYFSHSANGLICRDCQGGFPDRIELSRRAADALSELKQLADVDESTLNEIEKILVSYFTGILHKPPKMAKHILR